MPQTEESIGDDDKLFYHVPRNKFNPTFDFDDIPPHVFTPQGDGNLSVNWEKYCQTAEECLAIPSPRYPTGRTPQTHDIGHFIAKDVREIENLDVEYSPIPDNIAHSHIFGIPPKKTKAPYNEMRKKLKRAFKSWDIRPE